MRALVLAVLLLIAEGSMGLQTVVFNGGKTNLHVDGDITLRGEINKGRLAQIDALAASVQQLNSEGFLGDLKVRGTLYQQLGQQWGALITNSFTGGLDGVASDGTNFIAISSKGEIGVSTNGGQSFTLITGASNPFLATDVLISVVYGNGTWVIGSSTGKIGYSTNTGTSWTLATSPFAGTDNVVLGFGNLMFIAGATSGKLAYSMDGQTNWTLASYSPFIAGPNAVRTIAFVSGVFVAAGNGGILSQCTDGKIWSTAIATPFGGNNIFASAGGDGVFIIGGTNAGVATTGYLAISKDFGATWGSYVTFTYGSLTIGNVYSISYFNGIFQVGTQYGVSVRSYDNGVTWHGTLTPFGITGVLTGIAMGNNAGVMVGNIGGVGNISAAYWNPAYSLWQPVPTEPSLGTPHYHYNLYYNNSVLTVAGSPYTVNLSGIVPIGTTQVAISGVVSTVILNAIGIAYDGLGGVNPDCYISPVFTNIMGAPGITPYFGLVRLSSSLTFPISVFTGSITLTMMISRYWG